MEADSDNATKEDEFFDCKEQLDCHQTEENAANKIIEQDSSDSSSTTQSNIEHENITVGSPPNPCEEDESLVHQNESSLSDFQEVLSEEEIEV